MRKSEVFLQMVATQHLDRHWSRDLQVWVCLLPPPLQCGQGPQPGTPWKASHPTAAREPDSSARGCWDDRMSAPGKAVVNIIVLSFFMQKEYIFASDLSSQVTAMLVTLYQWCVWYLPHKPALFVTLYIQKAGHKIAALTVMPLWITNISLIQINSEFEYKIAVYIFVILTVGPVIFVWFSSTLILCVSHLKDMQSTNSRGKGQLQGIWILVRSVSVQVL